MSRGAYRLNGYLFRACAVAFVVASAVSLAAPDDVHRPVLARLGFSAAFLLGALCWWFAARACASIEHELRDKERIEAID